MSKEQNKKRIILFFLSITRAESQSFTEINWFTSNNLCFEFDKNTGFSSLKNIFNFNENDNHNLNYYMNVEGVKQKTEPPSDSVNIFVKCFLLRL